MLNGKEKLLVILQNYPSLQI